MSRKGHYILAFIIVILLCIHEVVLAKVDDTESRQYIGLTYEPIKPLDISLTYRLDLYENLSQFKRNSIDLSVSYDLIKWMRLISGYRFTTSYKNDRHRFIIGVAMKARSSNKKYQFQFRSLLNFDSEYLDRDYWKVEAPAYKLRLRTKFKYRLNKKVDLALFAEAFTRNSSQRYFFYRMRYGGGVEYAPSKAHSFEIGYFYQHEFNVKKPSTVQTFSAEYTFTIPSKKKKK